MQIQMFTSGVKTNDNTSFTALKCSPEKILELFHQGCSVSEIAKNLDISLSSVRKYIRAAGEYAPQKKYNLIDYDSFDREQITTLVKEGNSLSKLASHLGLRMSTVRQILKHFGLKTQQGSLVTGIDKAEICAMVDMGMSQKEIAQAIKLKDPGALTPILKKMGKQASRSKVDRITPFEYETFVLVGMSVSDIAQHLKVAPQIVFKKMKSLNLKTSQMLRNAKTIPAEELEKSVKSGLTIGEIAQKYNVNTSKVSALLKNNDLQTNSQKVKIAPPKELVEKEMQDCVSMEMLSRRLGVSRVTVRSLLKKYGLKFEKAVVVLPSAEDIGALIKSKPYISVDEIAEELGTSPETIDKLLAKFKIKPYRQIKTGSFYSFGFSKIVRHLYLCGDSPVQIGELCGVSTKKAQKIAGKLALDYAYVGNDTLKNIPKCKPSPKKAELQKLIQDLKDNDFGLSLFDSEKYLRLKICRKLGISDYTLTYLLGKYDLKDLVKSNTLKIME